MSQNPIWNLSIDATLNGNCTHQNGQNWNSGKNADSFTLNYIDANNVNRNLWLKNLATTIQKYSVVFLSVTSNMGTFPNSATYIVKGVNIGTNIATITVKFNDYTGSTTIGGDNAQLNFNYYT